MSEIRLISPLLDDFVVGDPISEHHGVRCCPAINKTTEDKYIVKIISVPASETQLNALLLSGAYSNKDSALSYYQDLAEGIADEAKILGELSQFEGFLSVDGIQTEAKDNGFDVYILSKYRNTLRHQLRRKAMTNLQALNLGLDLCAALAVSRRMGHLYVDLKPANVYLSGTQEYRIGDLGFVSLASLQYASLPERYRSAYTAPEISDAFSALNTTIDIYAVGLILYQVFNDGQLPFHEDAVPTEAFPAPAYADYEMAEIILKACALDPVQRWQDPVEMGQALVNYMQRNGVYDTPIVPIPPEQEEIAYINEEEVEGLYEEREEAAEEVTATEETTSAPEDGSEAETDIPSSESEGLTTQYTLPSPEDIPEEAIYTEDSEGNLTFIDDPSDETLEEQDNSEIEYDELTDEVSDMLLQADEIIAHEAPAPVVQPEPIDVSIPPVILVDEKPSEDDGVQISEEPSDESVEPGSEENDIAASEASEIAENDEISETDNNDVVPADNDPEAYDNEDDIQAKKHYGWILWLVLTLLAAGLAVALFFGYKNYYVQSIDSLDLIAGNSGELTVKIETSADESKLTVICSDTYGIQKSAPVTNGTAHFTDLMPNSAYNIKILIEGFHKLTGKTAISYATPAQTEILQYNAVTGAEDGSVILSFAYSGPEQEQWNVTYTTPEGTTEKVTFSGHMTTLANLQIGTKYTFTLTPESGIEVIGTNAITHTASKIIKPEKLLVAGCVDGKLSAVWSVGEDTDVSSWTVRCYNDSFDQTLVADKCSVIFDVPDVASNYTLEVKAAGMSVGARTEVAKNSVTATEFNIVDQDNSLNLNWKPAEGTSAEGWVLRYSVDGSPVTQLSDLSDNSTKITGIIPGAEYTFELVTAEGVPVLGGKQFFNTKEADTFAGYDVTAANMVFKMCKTPDVSNWDRYDLSNSDYTTTFTIGEKASFLVQLKHAYDTSRDNIGTLFVIRNSDGTIVDTSVTNSSWTDMWYRNYCELDIPQLPQVAGTYTISVYFNGAFANTTTFTVTE